MNDNTKMTDAQKIETLQGRIDEMKEKLFKIHSLATAICEYENSPKKDDNKISNVADNLAELIKREANEGTDIDMARDVIS